MGVLADSYSWEYVLSRCADGHLFWSYCRHGLLNRGTKCEAQSWSQHDRPLLHSGAQAHATNSFDAVVIELHPYELRDGYLAHPDAGSDMILQPTTDAEKCEVLPVFQPQTEIAE